MMTSPHALRPRSHFTLLFRAVTCGFLSAALAWAAEVRRSFDVPAGPAEKSLKTFSTQSGVEVVFSTAAADSVKTNAIKGELLPREALDRMLSGTGLVVAPNGQNGGLMVVRDPNVSRAAPASGDRPSPAVDRRVPTPVEVSRAAAASTSSRDETITLSPFEVRGEEDNGYQATSTLAGTRLRSDLKDVPAAVSVITKNFMEDVNATDLTSLLVYTLGTEVGGFGGNFSDLSNPEALGGFEDALGQDSPGTRVRGLIGADRTRGYFTTDVPDDTYNIDRLELSRGANANLFGLGSPAGIINASRLRAQLRKPATTVTAAFGSYGSYRGTLDHNYVLKRDVLALRVATVLDYTGYRTEFSFSKKRGLTLAATWQPFKDTTLRITSEIGQNDSNRPELRPPADRFSWWWDAGKPVWNPVTGTGRLLSTPRAPFAANTIFAANGTRTANNYLTGNFGQWQANVASVFFLDPNSGQAGGLPIGGGRTVDGVKGFADNSMLNAAGTALMSGGMTGLNSWVTVRRFIHEATNPLALLYGREPMVSNPAIFDFYHNNGAGPEKREWSYWNSHNATLERTFFEKRLGFEIAYDFQRMDSGFTSPINYTLNLDINEILPNGAPNPNYLRPVTASVGFKRKYSRDRDAARATMYYDLDLRRISRGPGWLGQALGRHVFNLNYSRQDSLYEQLGGFPYNFGPDWTSSNGQGVTQVSSNSTFIAAIRYMGPSVANATGPEDVRAQGLTVSQNISGTPSLTLLTNRRPPNTNVASYQPWTAETFRLLSNTDHSVSNSLRSGTRFADRTEQQVRSSAAAVQSHWLGGMIVTTAGWRRDMAWSYDSGVAPVSGINANINWDVWPTRLTRDIAQESSNWGVVGHLPERLKRRLPWGTDLSLIYNKATNFRVAPQRYTITGEALPSETGETKERGIRLSTFNGKLELRVTRHTTVADKATVGGVLPAINQMSLFVDNTIDQNYSGVNAANPAGIAAFEAWLDSPGGKNFQSAFATRLIANTDANRPAATYGKYSDAQSNRGQVAAASALQSTGTEFELILNPVRNWRISANASKTEAVRTNIAPELFNFLFAPSSGLMSVVQNPDATPTAAGRLIGGPIGGTQTLQSFLNSNVLNNGLITTFAQSGSKSDELRKWNFRAVTNYTFTSEQFGGKLKGFGVGAAVRWASRPLLGYAGTTIVNGGATLAVSDINRPYFGESEGIYDMWFSYGRKLTAKINWRVQLNIKNVGVGNELRPLFVWPDGTVVQWLIKDPQRWTVTNTFTF